MVKNPPANAGDTGWIPGSGRFPWRRKWPPTAVFFPRESQTEELDGLQSLGSQRVGHDLVTKQQQQNSQLCELGTIMGEHKGCLSTVARLVDGSRAEPTPLTTLPGRLLGRVS